MLVLAALSRAPGSDGVFQASVLPWPGTGTQTPAPAATATRTPAAPTATSLAPSQGDKPALYRQGAWFLPNSNSAGDADVSFNFGAAGDKPLVWR